MGNASSSLCSSRMFGHPAALPLVQADGYAKYVRSSGKYDSRNCWGTRDGLEISIRQDAGGAGGSQGYTCNTDAQDVPEPEVEDTDPSDDVKDLVEDSQNEMAIAAASK